MFYFKIEIIVSSFKVQSIELRAGYFCTSCKERLGFRKRRKKGQHVKGKKSLEMVNLKCLCQGK